MSPEPDLLPFKKGAFYLAVQCEYISPPDPVRALSQLAGVPIVPVVCQNYHHLYDGKSYFRSGTLRIKILPPIPTTDLTNADVPALMDKTRNLMLDALHEISQPDSPNGIPIPATSPTPLLADMRNSHDGYFSTSDRRSDDVSDAPEELDGSVVGMGTGRSDLQSTGRRRSREGKSRDGGEPETKTRDGRGGRTQEQRQLAIA